MHKGVVNRSVGAYSHRTAQFFMPVNDDINRIARLDDAVLRLTDADSAYGQKKKHLDRYSEGFQHEHARMWLFKVVRFRCLLDTLAGSKAQHPDTASPRHSHVKVMRPGRRAKVRLSSAFFPPV
ncbi:hypothetical protein DRI50_11420 [candidate division KSB1 bacterium]|nr:MAG: hypothetical protein DRI50_11420 [candidate division KSB1 bacterium]